MSSPHVAMSPKAFWHFQFPHVKVNEFFEVVFCLVPEIRSVVTTGYGHLHVLLCYIN